MAASLALATAVHAQIPAPSQAVLAQGSALAASCRTDGAFGQRFGKPIDDRAMASGGITGQKLDQLRPPFKASYTEADRDGKVVTSAGIRVTAASAWEAYALVAAIKAAVVADGATPFRHQTEEADHTFIVALKARPPSGHPISLEVMAFGEEVHIMCMDQGLVEEIEAAAGRYSGHEAPRRPDPPRSPPPMARPLDLAACDNPSRPDAMFTAFSRRPDVDEWSRYNEALFDWELFKVRPLGQWSDKQEYDFVMDMLAGLRPAGETDVVDEIVDTGDPIKDCQTLVKVLKAMQTLSLDKLARWPDVHAKMAAEARRRGVKLD